MKRGIYTVLAITVLAVLSLASCKKDYHCQCTYNNQVMLVKDLGSQVKKDADNLCSAYDSTITGEQWNCIVY